MLTPKRSLRKVIQSHTAKVEREEFVFGGFPDTVYLLNGYWAGNP